MGAVPIHVARMPKLFPFEVEEALYTKAPCIVLNPDKKIPPKVRLIKPISKLGENENSNIPKKNPETPVTKITDKCFWGERFPIINAPISAPNPSDEARIPISNSESNNFSLPRTGIRDTSGNPKILKISVVTKTNLRLTML